MSTDGCITKIMGLYNAYLAGIPVDRLRAYANNIPEQVLIRGNWDNLALTEYEILIEPGFCLVGGLDSHGQPQDVRVEISNSGEAMNGLNEHVLADALLWFAQLLLSSGDE